MCSYLLENNKSLFISVPCKLHPDAPHVVVPVFVGHGNAYLSSSTLVGCRLLGTLGSPLLGPGVIVARSG